MTRTKKSENEETALRIGGESMHTGEYARAHEECTEQRQGESNQSQQNGPNLEAAAFFCHG